MTRELGVKWRVKPEGEGFSVIVTATGKEPMAVARELVFGEPTPNTSYMETGESLGLQRETTLQLTMATHNPFHFWRMDLLRATGLAE